MDLTRSGGFAGRTLTLHLFSTGSLIVSEPERGLSVESETPPEELLEVSRLLQDACPFASTVRPQGCPDCFSYTLQVEMDGQTFFAQATDVDLANLGPLLEALNGLLDRPLTGQS